jgi:membrane-associated phospholipid phosphatase
MEGIFDFGIQIIIWLQGLGGWLVTPMNLFSFLGREEFFILLISAIYWCWNAMLGLRVFLLLNISVLVNSTLKLLFHMPRPYWYSTTVPVFAEETSFGIPSGHAQNAVVIWGGIASWIKKTWAWVVAILLILLISLSRLYLGVHFPTDVLAGWIIGALILWIYLLLEKPVGNWFKGLSWIMQLITIFVASLLLLLLTVLAKVLSSGFSLPSIWIENARLAFPESEPLNPFSINTAFSTAGTLFGFSAGVILLARQVGTWFDPSGIWWKRLLRYLVGIAGVLIIYLGLSFIFPHGDDLLANLLRYVRYAAVGLWATWLAPLVFYSLRLANRSGE